MASVGLATALSPRGPLALLIWPVDSADARPRAKPDEYRLIVPAGYTAQTVPRVCAVLQWTELGHGLHFDSIDIAPGSAADSMKAAQVAEHAAQYP